MVEKAEQLILELYLQEFHKRKRYTDKIETHLVKKILSWHFRIPKEYIHSIMGLMSEKKMIECNNCSFVILLKKPRLPY